MTDSQNTAAQQQGKPPVNISVSDHVKVGVYANAASSSVTANELILDFGYILPNQQPMTVEIVSRVNMTIRTAESLVQLLQGSINDYKTKVAQAQAQAQTQTQPQNQQQGGIPTEGPLS